MRGAVFTGFPQRNFAFHSDEHAINPMETSNVLSLLSLDYNLLLTEEKFKERPTLSPHHRDVIFIKTLL